jgi:polysaccharide biosynthesis/export protein
MCYTSGQIVIHNLRGVRSQENSAKSGRPSFTRQVFTQKVGWVYFFVFTASCFFAFCLVSVAAAQQSAVPVNQSNAQDAAQPASQAAVSASGAAKSQSGAPAPSNQTPNQAPSDHTSSDQNSANQTQSSSTDTSDQSGAMTKLGRGDLIEVNVYNVPELATKARVSNSGDVYLPLIDYVHVEGLTQEEAQTVIEKRLADGGFVRSPHVTIFVDEAASQGVNVMGEVSRPGIYPDVVDHKLYEVISVAGGFTASASRKIAIIRPGQPEPIRVDLPRNLADDLSGNIEVLPGDTINVPRAPIIYVVGDVGRPSGLLIDNGTLTVLQALALAGGTNHTAKMSGARIIRKTPEGMRETPLQLKKMLEAKTPDVTLQADDILFVPVSGARILAAQTVSAAISAATAVSIYTVHP